MINAALIKPKGPIVVEERLKSECSWLIEGLGKHAPSDADLLTCNVIKSIAESLLPLDPAVEGVVQHGLFESAKEIFRVPQLINEVSALKLVNRFPKLVVLLASNMHLFSQAQLSNSARKYLGVSATSEMLKGVCELLEAHDLLGADVDSFSGSFPRVSDLLQLAACIIDGKFVDWLMSGAPEELSHLQILVTRMKKDVSGEIKILSQLDGLVKQSKPIGVISSQKVLKI